MFTHALGRLDRAELRKQLGIGDDVRPERIEPLPLHDDEAPPPSPDAEPIDFSRARADTFAVVTHRASGIGLCALCLVGAVWAIFGGLAYGNGVSVLVIGAGWAVGSIVGSRVRRYDCARSECEAEIPSRARHCPRCGSTVHWQIESHAAAPDAFEALRIQRLQARRARQR